jgi:DNA-binding NarL/FixJ family response regulator
MKKIKIILASRPKMLSDVIRNIIEHQPDMMVVGEVIDPMELLHISNETEVDVVIVTPLKANGEPKICSHLLSDYPPLKIVTLTAKGEVAYLYQSKIPRLRINEPSGETILGAIRDSLRQVKDLPN